MSGQSLRVPVADLIKRAEAERARLVAAHAAQKVDPGETLAVSRSRLADRLEARASELRRGKAKGTIGSRYVSGSRRRNQGGRYQPTLSASIAVDIPGKPEPLDTEQVDRDLRLLRATSQETVAVRLDSDFARYV